MIACAALAVAAACAGPPISSYVVPNDATFAARPDRVVLVSGTKRLHVRTIGPNGHRQRVRGFDRYLVHSRKVFVDPAGNPDYFAADVQQSGRWIVIRASATNYYTEGAEDFSETSGEVVLAGTARGRVRELQACPGDGPNRLRSLDGSRLVLSSCNGSKIIVHDLARRARPIEVPAKAIFGGEPTGLALAGGYLAVTGYGPRAVEETIRVLRWPSLKPVYTLVGALVRPDFELARDGTLVATRIPEGENPFGRPDVSPCFDTKLETVWLSLAEPVPHVLPGTPCDDNLSLHGNQVLMGRLVAPAVKGFADTEVALTDLRGTASRRVLANENPYEPPAGFAFAPDGRVEVHRDGCNNDTWIDFFPLSDLLAGPLAPVRCRTRKAR